MKTTKSILYLFSVAIFLAFLTFGCGGGGGGSNDGDSATETAVFDTATFDDHYVFAK